MHVPGVRGAGGGLIASGHSGFADAFRALEVVFAKLRSLAPLLLFGIRLWASVCLALYLAFWLELDNPYWAGTSAAIICQPQLGASLRKGWFRMIGTLVGAVMSVVLTACFLQDRTLFLGALALWCAGCALAATVLRNFAAYAAALAGYTAAIIASDQLGATGGLNGDAFMLAIYRASEICIGIVSAGVVLAGTDLGGVPRRLGAQIADLTAKITGGLMATLAAAGTDLPDTQAARREFMRQVIALDPVIDQSLGESSRLRYHSPILQSAVDGLVAAVAGWRTVANHLNGLPADAAQQQAGTVLRSVETKLPTSPEADLLMVDPTGLHRSYGAAARRLIDLPAATPSLRLIADQVAEALAGIADALNGLALLIADPARQLPRGRVIRLHVADWLPGIVNAARAFVVIGAAALFWIVTAWPNGATGMTFAAITVILLAPRAEQAYAAAIGFLVGTSLAAVFAAVIGFAVLPGLGVETFLGFSLVLGLFLVPAGALTVQPWQTGLFTAMAANFVPLLAPQNEMSYDIVQFYNQALAIVVGCGAGALSFRFFPPLSPAFRTRRLLGLSLRDLRRLAAAHLRGDWRGRMRSRLAAFPDAATPLQRAQLLAAFSAGWEIIRLRGLARRLGFDGALENALAALAQRDSRIAVARLDLLNEGLAAPANEQADVQHGRGSILALTELLIQHAAFFDAGAVE